MKVNTLRFPKGGLGASPQKPKIFVKKSNETKAFPLRWDCLNYISYFWQGSLIPKTMSLLPKSLKIITSASQLPENK